MFGFKLQLDLSLDATYWPQATIADVANDQQHWFDVTLDNGDRLLLYGYFWGYALEQLTQSVKNRDFEQLNLLEGHFCGVLVSQGQVFLFADRYHAKALYWRHQHQQLHVTSHLQNFDDQWLEFSDIGWQQCLYFRFESQASGFYKHILHLPMRSVATISANEYRITQHPWSAPVLAATNFDEQCQRTHQALVNNLRKARTQHKKVAILLSGGVDSSLIAALAKQEFDDCLLVSARFNNFAGELHMAQQFASQLRLPQLIVDIDESQLSKDFSGLLNHYRKPLRHYSSLVMMQLLRAIPSSYTAVLYGEAADSMMGSFGVKKTRTKLALKANLPRWLAPLIRALKLDHLTKFQFVQKTLTKTIKEIFYDAFAIQYRPASATFLNRYCHNYYGRQAHVDCLALPQEHSRIAIMNLLIDHEVAQHYDETEAIAELFDKQIISPFMDNQVYAISLSLTDKQYFGQQWLKPVLRELACRYYPKAWIYQQKKGFPVPMQAWLSDAFVTLVNNAKQNVISLHVDNRTVNEEQDYELYWLLINLTQLSDCTGLNHLRSLFSGSLSARLENADKAALSAIQTNAHNISTRSTQ